MTPRKQLQICLIQHLWSIIDANRSADKVINIGKKAWEPMIKGIYDQLFEQIQSQLGHNVYSELSSNQDYNEET